jgi:outer membrane receptor protein involved in Fe transport
MSRGRHVFRVVALLGILGLGVSPSVRAQATGAMTGTVLDQTGAPLPGVAVTATDSATGRTRSATSSAQGFFRIDSMAPSTYSVRAELHGFRAAEARGVVLAGTAVVTVSLTLQVSAAGEEVEVVAASPLVNVTQDQLKTQVDAAMMQKLPINGRRFQDFALLAPGVHIDFASSQAGGGDAIAFFGFDERSKALFVDGVDLNDELTRGGTGITDAPRNQYSMEAIEETEILRNQFSAEVGRAQAGVINIITRSGTNRFSGGVFGFFRDDSFDKKNVFASGKIPFSQQQFGGSLGGPITKDRTHFFLSYERWKQTQVATIRIPAALLPVLRDTRTEIPASDARDNVFAKLTHTLAPAHVLNVSYTFNHKTADGQAAAANAAADARFHELRRDHLLIARLTSTIGTRATNEVRGAFSHTFTDRPVDTPAPELLFPSLRTGTPNNMPQGRRQTNYMLNDIYTQQFSLAGEHSVKLGAGLNIVRYPTKLNLFQFGQFSFAKDAPPGPDNPPTQYILGRYASEFADLDGNYYSAFVQDDWRVTPRLTLNLGLRYDVETYSGSYSGQGYPAFGSTDEAIRFLLTTLPGGTNATVNYRSRNDDKNNIQPRIGFNWAATKDSRTSVRGGYGIFTEAGQDPISVQGTLGHGRAATYVAPGAVFPLLSFYPNEPPADLLNRFFRISLTSQFPGVFITSAFAHQFTLGVERQLPWDTSVAVDYAGIRSRNNPRDVNVNHPDASGHNPFLASGAAVTVNLSDGEINTDTVMVQVRRRLTRRVGFLLAYTWLKANKDGPSSSPFLRALDYGPTSNDVRHHVSASVNAQLPWAVELATVVTAASAFPYNELAGRDVTKDGVPTNDRPAGVSYNSLRGDNYFSASLRVSKTIRLGGRSRLQLLAEAFNLFNTTNYNNYVGTVTSPFFQQPVQALPPFQAQFGARFQF